MTSPPGRAAHALSEPGGTDLTCLRRAKAVPRPRPGGVIVISNYKYIGPAPVLETTFPFVLLLSVVNRGFSPSLEARSPLFYIFFPLFSTPGLWFPFFLMHIFY
jgi:hypothetical protein